MPREFSSRRGYELYKWLPVIAGRIIGSSDESERFLCDWRKTIGELIAENLYGESERIAHENGMQTYFESNENSRQYLADGMSVKSHADCLACVDGLADGKVDAVALCADAGASFA